MSLKTPLLTFDFEKQPFDGDPRQAHQFIPFLLGKLGASQLSYILNVQQYPDPQITEYALLKEQEHASDQAIAAVEFKEAMDTYTHQMLARELEINHIRRTVADPQERANQISAKIAPTMPKLRDVASLGSTAHDLGKTRELIRKYDIAADQALQIIKSFLSPRLLNMCSPIRRRTPLGRETAKNLGMASESTQSQRASHRRNQKGHHHAARNYQLCRSYQHNFSNEPTPVGTHNPSCPTLRH